MTLWIFLDNIIVWKSCILHFKGLGMKNLYYEMRICQKSHNKVTKTVDVWFEFLWISVTTPTAAKSRWHFSLQRSRISGPEEIWRELRIVGVDSIYLLTSTEFWLRDNSNTAPTIRFFFNFLMWTDKIIFKRWDPCLCILRTYWIDFISFIYFIRCS